MQIEFSPDLARKLRDEGTMKTILKYIHKVNWLKTIVYYMIDWRTRKQVNLQNWLKAHLEAPGEAITQLDHISDLKTNRAKIRQIMRFVHTNIKYKKDKEQWDVEEKWQTPTETWNFKTGDCEDHALLIYAIAHYFDIPDYQLHITAGDTVVGGHCYLVYVCELDGLMYPIDSTVYPEKSFSMDKPYHKRSDYYNGTKEWFRFNSTAAYKLWRK